MAVTMDARVSISIYNMGVFLLVADACSTDVFWLMFLVVLAMVIRGCVYVEHHVCGAGQLRPTVQQPFY